MGWVQIPFTPSSLQLIIDRPQVPLGDKSRTNTGQRFGGSDEQIPIWFQHIRNFVEQFFPILKGEVNGHIPAKNDVKLAYPRKRLHQVHVPKGGHGTDLIPYFPVAAGRFEIALELLSRESSLDFEFVVSACTGLGNGGIGEIGAHE